MIKKALAGAGIALALLIATPLAANAAPEPYVASEDVIVSDSTPVAGQAVTVTFDEAFLGGEQVNFTVTGEGAVTIAAITTASVTKVASADGTVSAVVTLPTNATGTYTVTATGVTSGTIGTAALTVVAVSADSGSGSVTLPFTGGTLPIAAIWIASGVLVLGVVLLSVVGIRRRNASTN